MKHKDGVEGDDNNTNERNDGTNDDNDNEVWWAEWQRKGKERRLARGEGSRKGGIPPRLIIFDADEVLWTPSLLQIRLDEERYRRSMFSKMKNKMRKISRRERRWKEQGEDEDQGEDKTIEEKESLESEEAQQEEEERIADEIDDPPVVGPFYPKYNGLYLESFPRSPLPIHYHRDNDNDGGEFTAAASTTKPTIIKKNAGISPQLLQQPNKQKHMKKKTVNQIQIQNQEKENLVSQSGELQDGVRTNAEDAAAAVMAAAASRLNDHRLDGLHGAKKQKQQQGEEKNKNNLLGVSDADDSQDQISNVDFDGESVDFDGENYFLNENDELDTYGITVKVPYDEWSLPINIEDGGAQFAWEDAPVRPSSASASSASSSSSSSSSSSPSSSSSSSAVLTSPSSSSTSSSTSFTTPHPGGEGKAEEAEVIGTTTSGWSGQLLLHSEVRAALRSLINTDAFQTGQMEFAVISETYGVLDLFTLDGRDALLDRKVGREGGGAPKPKPKSSSHPPAAQQPGPDDAPEYEPEIGLPWTQSRYTPDPPEIGMNKLNNYFEYQEVASNDRLEQLKYLQRRAGGVPFNQMIYFGSRMTEMLLVTDDDDDDVDGDIDDYDDDADDIIGGNDGDGGGGGGVKETEPGEKEDETAAATAVDHGELPPDDQITLPPDTEEHYYFFDEGKVRKVRKDDKDLDSTIQQNQPEQHQQQQQINQQQRNPTATQEQKQPDGKKEGNKKDGKEDLFDDHFRHRLTPLKEIEKLGVTVVRVEGGGGLVEDDVWEAIADWRSTYHQTNRQRRREEEGKKKKKKLKEEQRHQQPQHQQNIKNKVKIRGGDSASSSPFLHPSKTTLPSESPQGSKSMGTSSMGSSKSRSEMPPALGRNEHMDVSITEINEGGPPPPPPAPPLQYDKEHPAWQKWLQYAYNGFKGTNFTGHQHRHHAGGLTPAEIDSQSFHLGDNSWEDNTMNDDRDTNAADDDEDDVEDGKMTTIKTKTKKKKKKTKKKFPQQSLNTFVSSSSSSSSISFSSDTHQQQHVDPDLYQAFEESSDKYTPPSSSDHLDRNNRRHRPTSSSLSLSEMYRRHRRVRRERERERENQKERNREGEEGEKEKEEEEKEKEKENKGGDEDDDDDHRRDDDEDMDDEEEEDQDDQDDENDDDGGLFEEVGDHSDWKEWLQLAEKLDARRANFSREHSAAAAAEGKEEGEEKGKEIGRVQGRENKFFALLPSRTTSSATTASTSTSTSTANTHRHRQNNILSFDRRSSSFIMASASHHHREAPRTTWLPLYLSAASATTPPPSTSAVIMMPPALSLLALGVMMTVMTLVSVSVPSKKRKKNNIMKLTSPDSQEGDDCYLMIRI